MIVHGDVVVLGVVLEGVVLEDLALDGSELPPNIDCRPLMSVPVKDGWPCVSCAVLLAGGGGGAACDGDALVGPEAVDGPCGAPVPGPPVFAAGPDVLPELVLVDPVCVPGPCDAELVPPGGVEPVVVEPEFDAVDVVPDDVEAEPLPVGQWPTPAEPCDPPDEAPLAPPPEDDPPCALPPPAPPFPPEPPGPPGCADATETERASASAAPASGSTRS